MAEIVHKNHERLDVLVSNAGIEHAGTILETAEEEIAASVLDLAADEAAFVTGTALMIDGWKIKLLLPSRG